MKIRPKNGSCEVIELEKDDQIQLLVPASEERTCVYLSVSWDGKLNIEGGSSVISEISGDGMREKIKRKRRRK